MIVKCQHCGKPFRAKPSWTKGGNQTRGFYCTRECYGASLRSFIRANRSNACAAPSQAPPA